MWLLIVCRVLACTFSWERFASSVPLTTSDNGYLPRYQQNGRANTVLPAVDRAITIASFPHPAVSTHRAATQLPLPYSAIRQWPLSKRHQANFSGSRTARFHTASDNLRGATLTFQGTEMFACSFLRRRRRIFRGRNQFGSPTATRSFTYPDAFGTPTANSTARNPALRSLWRKPPENGEVPSSLPTFALGPTSFFDRHSFSRKLRTDDNRPKTGRGPTRASTAAGGGQLWPL